MQAEITCLSDTDTPRALTEILTLGRTLKRHSRLGCRNLTNYITRALLETGGFRPQLHPQL